MGEKWLRELSGREVVKGVEWGEKWLRELSGERSG